MCSKKISSSSISEKKWNKQRYVCLFWNMLKHTKHVPSWLVGLRNFWHITFDIFPKATRLQESSNQSCEYFLEKKPQDYCPHSQPSQLLRLEQISSNPSEMCWPSAGSWRCLIYHIAIKELIKPNKTCRFYQTKWAM